MSKDQFKPIKQCILIAETLSSDYHSASVFQKLGSIPTIQLVISWLAAHGIAEIFICHSNKNQQLRTYYEGIEKYCDSKLQLVLMHPENLKNFGQVMRYVHFRGLINEEFLIVHGDMITNLDLSKAIQIHHKKKKDLKNVVMTTIMRQGGEDNHIHLTNYQTGQILQINQDNGQSFNLNPQRIKLKKMNVQMRRDLSYCDIYICNIDVLNSFKEIQDYSTMFDYIEAMLTSDVFDQKIVAYTLEGSELSYRTNTAKQCYLGHMNYLCKHLYPYTLFNKTKFPKWVKSDNANYFSSVFNKVLWNTANISRTASISSNCYIGNNAQVGERVIVNKSVIGDNCVIEENTSINNCIIMDGCFIEKGGKYENCLIQNANEIQHVRPFNLACFKGFLVEKPLFIETPVNEEQQPSPLVNTTTTAQNNPQSQMILEKQLQNMMEDEPSLQIVTELYTVRKRNNQTLQEFTKTMIKVKSPKGLEGVKNFVEQWGKIIVRMHDEKQSAVINSVYYSCKQLSRYGNAFHIFLQWFNLLHYLNNFAVIQWFKDAKQKNPECPTLQKCEKFIEKLEQEEDEDDDEDDQGSDQNSDASD